MLTFNSEVACIEETEDIVPNTLLMCVLMVMNLGVKF